MSEDTVTTRLAIEVDDGISQPSAEAARALTELRDRIAEDTAALSQMQKAMRELKQAGQSNTAEFQAIKAAVERKRAAVAAANKEYLQLGGTFRKLKDQTPLGRFKALTSELQGLPGPLGQVGGSVNRVVQSLTATRLIALGVAAAVAVLVAATVKAGKSLYDYATQQANARRMELLRLDGLTKIRTVFSMTFGLATDKASDLQGVLDRVAASTSAGRDKLVGYVRQLELMGVRGKNLETILGGMAMKSEVQGEAQAQQFAGWAAGLALTGGNVQRYADRVKAQIGGTARRMFLDANVQSEKLRESLSHLTDSINVEKLNVARADFYALFSESTESGRALKQLLTTLVQPMVDAVTRALPTIKHFVQDLIIGALRIEIAWLKLRLAWRKLFDKGDVVPLINTIGDGLATFLRTWVTRVLPAAGKLVLQLTWFMVKAMLAVPVIVLAAAGVAIASVITGLWKAVSGPLRDGTRALFQWLGRLLVAALQGIGNIIVGGLRIFAEGGAKLAKALWSGLVDGITGGAKAAAKAVTSIAGDLVTAFKQAIDAHSPSRVFMRLGLTIPAGVQAGIEQGTPGANAAASSLITAPTIPTASVRSAPVAAPRGGGSITINELKVVTKDTGDVRQLAQDVKAELERILEQVAIGMGAATPGEAA